MKKKGSLLWTILTVITALLLVVCIVAIPVTNAFATAIDRKSTRLNSSH